MTEALYEVPDEDVEETWESMLKKITKLGKKINAQTLIDRTPITRIVMLPRGGLHVTNILARMLALSGHEVINMGISRFSREHPRMAGQLKIGQLPTRKLVKNQNILVPDEVHETGQTLKYATDFLYGLGALNVRTAVVHYKPGKDTSGRVPNFYIDETNGWVRYPWDPFDEIGTEYKQAMEDRINGHRRVSNSLSVDK